MSSFYEKYLKYKIKYLELKSIKEEMSPDSQSEPPAQTGGSSNKMSIMLFKAEWCGHCKNFMPIWNKLKDSYSKKFNFLTYDSEKDKDYMSEMGINGYPTIMIKEGDTIEPYNGPREYDALVSILSNLKST